MDSRLKKRALGRQLKSLAMGTFALGMFATVAVMSLAAGKDISDPTTWLIVGGSAMILLPLPILQLLMFSFNKGIRFHRLATYYLLEYAGAAYSVLGLGALKFLGTIGRAEYYQEQVRYRDAEAVALRTLNQYSTKNNDPVLKSVIRLNALLAANIECKLGRYDRALQIADEYFTPLWQSYSLTKNESLFNELGSTLNQFGCILDHLGKYDESYACYSLSVSMRESINDEQLDVSLCNAGFANLRLGNFEQAQKNLTDALTVVEINGRINSDVGAAIHCNLGETLLECGRIEEARKHLELAMKQRDKLPNNSPDIAQVKGAYASLCAREGNDNEAQKLYEKCITIYKDSIGLDNADAAFLLRNYATLCENNGSSDKSQSLMQQVKEINAKLEAIEFPQNLEKCMKELTNKRSENDSVSDSAIGDASSVPGTNQAIKNSDLNRTSEFSVQNQTTETPGLKQTTDDIVIDRSAGAIPGIHHSLEASYKVVSAQSWFSYAAIAYFIYLAIKDTSSLSSIALVMGTALIGYSLFMRHRRKARLQHINHILMTQNPAPAEATLCVESLGPLKDYVGIVHSGTANSLPETKITFSMPDPDVTSVFNNQTSPVRIFKDPGSEKIVAIATHLGTVVASQGVLANKGLKTRLAVSIGSILVVPFVVSAVFLAAIVTCSPKPPSAMQKNLPAK